MVEPAVENVPAAHCEHDDEAAVEEMEPPEHNVQLLDPIDEYVPALQDTHDVEPAVEYVPATHRVHDEAYPMLEY